MEPVPDHNVASQMLDKIFGEPWIVSKSKVKVPSPVRWRIRSWPVLVETDLSERKVDRTQSDSEKFHPALLDARCEGADLSLPSPEDIETYYDSHFGDTSTQRDITQVEAFKLLHCVAAPAPGSGASAMLLDRGDMARLWGVDGWNIDKAYSRVSPCCGWCTCSTGFQAPPGSPGATACGRGRWCFTCDAWYTMLNNTPPPHAWALLDVLLKKSLQMKNSEGNNHFSRLPSHSCDGSGCGCY